MFGNFQQSHLRIELEASESTIRESLLKTHHLKAWLFPQRLSSGLPETLEAGLTFKSWLGWLPIQHQVEVVGDYCLRLLLSQGIDGYHEWMWGDGWVQSRLEGVSLLPLNLGQSISVSRLREYVKLWEDLRQ